MFILQHVDCVGIDMRVDIDTQTFSCLHKLLVVRRVDARRAAESTRFGVVALLLSGVRYCTRSLCKLRLRLWSRTQITLAVRGCMVLMSVNAVLILLKRRGRHTSGAERTW